MKNYLFLLCLLLSSATQLFAIEPPYVVRETSNGGLFGYARTTRKEVKWVDNIGIERTNVNIHCDDPGLTRCPKELIRLPETPLDFLSDAEITLSNDLMDAALTAISSGDLTGSNHQQILVSYPDGSSKLYLITVQWLSDDTNATNSRIELYREEITQ